MDEMKKVVDMEEVKIKLKGEDFFAIANLMSPMRKGWDKLLQLSTISGKTQYWLFRIWKKIASEFENLDKARIALAKEYAAKDENGKPIETDGRIIISDENTAEFNTKWQELLMEEINLPFQKVKISSDFLEKMNVKAEVEKRSAIDINDMILLEKIIDFIE